uniref:Putative NADH dehydrogenase n=2 Tax=viral metagenome TaxID=1070528 RepID=A0A6H1ZK38_9ZZZZ
MDRERDYKMNVKIIGGSGFIGNHLSKRMASQGHHVTVLDLKKPRILGANVYRPDSGEASWYNPIKFAGIDITNYRDVYWNIDRGDYVINVAAIAQFAQAESDPHFTMSVNVTGAANVLKACIDNKAAKLIYTSTGSVYSTDVKVPIDEDQPTEPTSTYGMSKLWAERIQMHYADKIPLTILRLPHVVGPGKVSGANTFIVKLKANERPVIFGDGSNKNDFTCVDDVVQAIELALTKEATGIFNIGSGESRSTLDFLTWSRRLLDKMHIEPVFAPPRGVDFPVFEYNIDKAKKELGYRPKCNLEDTLRKTIVEFEQWL